MESSRRHGRTHKGTKEAQTLIPWLCSLLDDTRPSQCLCLCLRLLDHPVRLEEEGRGNREAEGLGGLAIDGQLELRRLFHR
jgi:hypothetical protein